MNHFNQIVEIGLQYKTKTGITTPVPDFSKFKSYAKKRLVINEWLIYNAIEETKRQFNGFEGYILPHINIKKITKAELYLINSILGER